MGTPTVSPIDLSDIVALASTEYSSTDGVSKAVVSREGDSARGSWESSGAVAIRR